METDVYFSAAILGVILALIFIIGWRRIVPVVVAGYIVGTSPAIAQSGGDVDNDVPAINEVRDALLAQKLMLDNYFSGYTSPNKLNDISNLLQDIEADTDYYLPNMATKLTNIRNNTSDISNAQTYTNNLLGYNLSPRLDDISNYSEDSLSELQDISNTLSDGLYLNPSTPYLDQITYHTSKTRQLLNGVDSSSLLLNLDQDNDVPKLTEIAVSTENSYLEMKNIREKLDAVYGDPVDNNFAGITSAQPVYAGVTLETFDEQVASKPSPTIGYDIDNYDTGFEAITDSFNLSGFQNTEIPLLNVSSTPTIGGDLIGSINYNMGQHASFLSGIIRPLLTAWVCYLILSFTTRKTVDLIAA